MKANQLHADRTSATNPRPGGGCSVDFGCGPLFSPSERKVLLCSAILPSLAVASSRLPSPRSLRRSLRRITAGTTPTRPTSLDSTTTAVPLRATTQHRMSRSSSMTVGFPGRANSAAVRRTGTGPEAAHEWAASPFSIVHRNAAVDLGRTSRSSAPIFCPTRFPLSTERSGTPCSVITMSSATTITCRHTTPPLDQCSIHRTPPCLRNWRISYQAVISTPASMNVAEPVAIDRRSFSAVARSRGCDRYQGSRYRKTESGSPEFYLSASEIKPPMDGRISFNRTDAHLTCTPVQTGVNSPLR